MRFITISLIACTDKLPHLVSVQLAIEMFFLCFCRYLWSIELFLNHLQTCISVYVMEEWYTERLKQNLTKL